AGSEHAPTLRRLAELFRLDRDYVKADQMFLRAANAGDTEAFLDLGQLRLDYGDEVGAHEAYEHAAEAGEPVALLRLAWLYEKSGDLGASEELLYRAAGSGIIEALMDLARRQELLGADESAIRLYKRAADAGNSDALYPLAWHSVAVRDVEAAEHLFLRAARSGNNEAFMFLGELREEVENYAGAWRAYREAADAGNFRAIMLFISTNDWEVARRGLQRIAQEQGAEGLKQLADIMERSDMGEGDVIEVLRLSADAGSPQALRHLVAKLDDGQHAESIENAYQQAARNGNPEALRRSARLCKQGGDLEGAAEILRRASDSGDDTAHWDLIELYERAKDPRNVEWAYQRVINSATNDQLAFRRKIAARFSPEVRKWGLTVDGALEEPWWDLSAERKPFGQ
ncbi:hypothetical protein ACFW2N_30195, partial [Streptomyces sp. NPDC058855]